MLLYVLALKLGVAAAADPGFFWHISDIHVGFGNNETPVRALFIRGLTCCCSCSFVLTPCSPR
jgi:hypothetical protein